jgi:TPR repeat protein
VKNKRLNLALRYEIGEGGIAQDDIEAFNWYRLAANDGNANGQAGLGTPISNYAALLC